MDHTTFIMLKPDALEAHLENKILDVFRENGITILRKKVVIVDEKLILAHYAEVIERLKDNVPDFPQRILKEFVDKTVKIYEIGYHHHDIVAKVRALIGATDPAKAEPESIRGKYATDTMEKSNAEGRMLRNLIHASDSDENAKKELELWFK
ncbi:MAG: nucleoside-diphosphate kinase [Erysipelotrichaceae bacterium]|nr:MAG: nucleoside-diphosphate [Erysipelotrichaceae bacterium]TXT19116.1 MAG: nucleoside-diphosphate kinase [Erysipelotrichaceae bacterium]